MGLFMDENQAREMSSKLPVSQFRDKCVYDTVAVGVPS